MKISIKARLKDRIVTLERDWYDYDSVVPVYEHLKNMIDEIVRNEEKEFFKNAK